MALIEIGGLPIKDGESFHGYVSHNQMVTIMNQYFYEPLCYEPLWTIINHYNQMVTIMVTIITIPYGTPVHR